MTSLSRIWLQTSFPCLLSKGILDNYVLQCNTCTVSEICGDILVTLTKFAVQAAHSGNTILQVCKHWCFINIDGHDLTATLCTYVYACYVHNMRQVLLCSIESQINLCVLF